MYDYTNDPAKRAERAEHLRDVSALGDFMDAKRREAQLARRLSTMPARVIARAYTQLPFMHTPPIPAMQDVIVLHMRRGPDGEDLPAPKMPSAKQPFGTPVTTEDKGGMSPTQFYALRDLEDVSLLIRENRAETPMMQLAKELGWTNNRATKAKRAAMAQLGIDVPKKNRQRRY